MHAPLVTVGIPTYNRPKGLERTLACITQQTYPNLEIIVSDNCSTNKDVLPILQKFAEQDSRVKYFVQEKNRSIIPNFQFLLDQANGEYFMWAADDDDWDHNFIEVCVKGMVANDKVVLCMTDLKFVDTNGLQTNSRLKKGFMQNNLFLRSFYFVKSTIEYKYFFCGMYRTHTVKNVPFDNSWGGDHLLLYELISKGKFMYIPEANFYYHRGGNSKKMSTVKTAFDIKSKFYFFDAYTLRYTTYQFNFKHLNILKKLGMFCSSVAGLVLNDDFVLYYIFIKKPVRALINKAIEYHK